MSGLSMIGCFTDIPLIYISVGNYGLLALELFPT